MELRVKVNSSIDSQKLLLDIENLFTVLEGIGECAVLKIGNHEIPLRFCNHLTFVASGLRERTLEFDLKSIKR